MELTRLSDKPHLYPAVLSLIERNFHYQKPQAYNIDFAPLMIPTHWAHNHLLIEGETVICHIGVSLRLWGDQKVALLGGIATDERFQGKGYFKNLFTHVLSLYEKEIQAYVLWSDLHSLYEKYGFTPMKGMIQTGERNFSCPQGYEEKSFLSLSSIEFNQLSSLYNTMAKTFISLERTEKDWKTLKEITSTKIYIAKDENQNITRYFCLGKGMDLNDIIHEVGFKDKQEKEKLYKDVGSFKLWLPLSEKQYFPQAPELILALFKGSIVFSPQLYISGLDSI